MLSLSHSETMLNSVKGKENIKTDYELFLSQSSIAMCVLGVEFGISTFQYSQFPSNWETSPLKSTRNSVKHSLQEAEILAAS